MAARCRCGKGGEAACEALAAKAGVWQMAVTTGLEPATFALTGRRSGQLIYVTGNLDAQARFELAISWFRARCATDRTAGQFGRLGGSRTHGQEIKSLLLWPLSYEPMTGYSIGYLLAGPCPRPPFS